MSPEDDPDAIEVEWDSNKEVANQRKHGISFYEAATVFFDPLSLTAPDVEHSMGEQRHNIIGVSSEGELVVVTYTERQQQNDSIGCGLLAPEHQRKVKEGIMKRAIDFKGGVRGKYAGKKLVILGATATASDEALKPRSKNSLTVKIDEDVAAVFKSPEAINEALRSLIQILAMTNR